MVYTARQGFEAEELGGIQYYTRRYIQDLAMLHYIFMYTECYIQETLYTPMEALAEFSAYFVLLFLQKRNDGICQ